MNGNPFQEGTCPVRAGARAFSVIATSGSVGKGRWEPLVASGAIERVGPTHYKCRGNVSCKAFTTPQATAARARPTRSRTRSRAARSCCPQLLPKELLLKVLATYRAKGEKMLRTWVAQQPPRASGLLGFVERKMGAITAPSNIMHAEMSFGEKIATMSSVLAGALAAAGLPFTAAVSDFGGAIIHAFDETCPLPSTHTVARRIPHPPALPRSHSHAAQQARAHPAGLPPALAHALKRGHAAPHVDEMYEACEDDDLDGGVDLVAAVEDAVMLGEDGDIELEIELVTAAAAAAAADSDVDSS